jgi:hypothetical protein
MPCRAHSEEQYNRSYVERAFFHSNRGNSAFAARLKYALAYSAARSFPCSMSSTLSDGAIQLFVVTW